MLNGQSYSHSGVEVSAYICVCVCLSSLNVQGAVKKVSNNWLHVYFPEGFSLA